MHEGQCGSRNIESEFSHRFSSRSQFLRSDVGVAGQLRKALEQMFDDFALGRIIDRRGDHPTLVCSVGAKKELIGSADLNGGYFFRLDRDERGWRRRRFIAG